MEKVGPVEEWDRGPSDTGLGKCWGTECLLYLQDLLSGMLGP